MIERVLLERHIRTLDRLEYRDNVLVVGWHESRNGYGPIVQFPSGERRLVNVTGRLRILPSQ